MGFDGGRVEAMAVGGAVLAGRCWCLWGVYFLEAALGGRVGGGNG